MWQESSAAACFSLSFPQQYWEKQLQLFMHLTYRKIHQRRFRNGHGSFRNPLYLRQGHQHSDWRKAPRNGNHPPFWTEENSQISQLNNAEGKTMEVSDDLVADLEKIRQLSQDSDGVFDPHLWKDHPPVEH